MKTPTKKRKTFHPFVSPLGKRKRGFEGFVSSVQKKGLTLPGYNYLGPFNSLDNGEPTNQSDAAARDHDREYGRIGKRAYFFYNEADEKFMRNTGNDIGGKIGRAVFSIKKKIAPKITARPRPTVEKLRLLVNKPATTQAMSDTDGSGSGTASQTTTNNNAVVFEMITKLDYLVEFKELHDGFHWPVSQQPIPRFTAQLTDPTGSKQVDETAAPSMDVSM
ncbi:hypothetical protein PINS_up016540 [Pythium insidiosum]|nr:hypothetical protein PINS_up016540 [Pythium insidiosum]